MGIGVAHSHQAECHKMYLFHRFSSLFGHTFTFLHFAFFHKTFKLFFSFFELFHKDIIGVKARYYGAGYKACRIYITLEVIPANHATLSHFIAAFEDFVLFIYVDFGKYQSSSLANSGVS